MQNSLELYSSWADIHQIHVTINTLLQISTNVPAIHVETMEIAMMEWTSTHAHVQKAFLENIVNMVGSKTFGYTLGMQGCR